MSVYNALKFAYNEIMRLRQAMKLWNCCRVKNRQDGFSVSMAAKYVSRGTRQASLRRIAKYEKKYDVKFWAE